MKILVLAQTPPPVHGQSLMVRAMLDGLPPLGIEVRHVPIVLSRTHEEIGRWQPRKVLGALRAGFAARRIGRAERFDALYYVPAPGKRGTLWRDLIILGLARPAAPRLVLHWHAPGLGEWATAEATAWERRRAHRALGAADLSIVLSPNLEADAAVFNPRRTRVVSNGVPDPGEPAPHSAASPIDVLFVGLGSRTKGLIDTAEAVALLQKRRPNEFRLTFAGSFANRLDEAKFDHWAGSSHGSIRRVGFADDVQKHALLSKADIFCFPTYYPQEGQPLALVEAMAHDVRIVATRWRSIPEMLPVKNVWFVEPAKPVELAAAIEAAAAAPAPAGAMRRHYLDNFTLERHLASMKLALLSLGA
jgi:glycosyltransferase involved in cell wall biosynthesis